VDGVKAAVVAILELTRVRRMLITCIFFVIYGVYGAPRDESDNKSIAYVLMTGVVAAPP
jgi:hypothetical protein